MHGISDDAAPPCYAIPLATPHLLPCYNLTTLHLSEVHFTSVEMLREFVASQLAAGVESRAKRDELEVAKLLLEKQVGRKEVELEERAERERKLQAEVFRLNEKLMAVARQAEALDAKNAELEELREGKVRFDAALHAAMQERDGRIAQLTHEASAMHKLASQAQGDAVQTIEQLEQQVAALHSKLGDASEAASEAEATVKVDHATFDSELRASEKATDKLERQLGRYKAAMSAGVTAQARLDAGLVGLAALRSSLKQADVELSHAGAAVRGARIDEKRAVSRAEMATQAMEQTTLQFDEARS